MKPLIFNTIPITDRIIFLRWLIPSNMPMIPEITPKIGQMIHKPPKALKIATGDIDNQLRLIKRAFIPKVIIKTQGK